MKRGERGDFSVASGASVSNALDDLSSRLKTMMDMLPRKQRVEDGAHERWAKRVARRVRREKFLEEGNDRGNHSPDQLMRMLCRAEQISEAVHSDLLRMGSNINANAESLRRIRKSQSLLNRDLLNGIDHGTENDTLENQSFTRRPRLPNDFMDEQAPRAGSDRGTID